MYLHSQKLNCCSKHHYYWEKILCKSPTDKEKIVTKCPYCFEDKEYREQINKFMENGNKY